MSLIGQALAGKSSRPTRLKRIAAHRLEKARRAGHARSPRPLRRYTRKGRTRKMIAYDLETTLIAKGNPRPIYLTAHGADFFYSGRTDSMQHLRDILVSQFLTVENSRVRFIAWNGNKFDVFFIGAALLYSREYVIRPYLTRNNALRGLKVVERETNREWEFLDGLAMTLGNKPCTLKEFLETFAPDYMKLDAPDWEGGEEFNPDNPQHVAYAERDSEGLYHGMMRAEQIVREHFQQPLAPTIGNLGIRLFQQHMPANIEAWAPSYELDKIIRTFIMRGGFCFSARVHDGPVWKYDINQAYAAAMRDARMPCGSTTRTLRYVEGKCAIYRVNGFCKGAQVPFYICGEKGNGTTITDTLAGHWLTSIEFDQLYSEGWTLEILEGYFWSDSFVMPEYVDKLENLRMNAPGGPKSAQGEMMKAIGNNSYGKTVEELGGYELVMAAECPEGFFQFQDGTDPIQHIWIKFGVPQCREYHQPQIGAFITAHVRMVVRRAILRAPKEWLYSDTDCCMYSIPVDLPIDAGKYGLWKVEAAGVPYYLITKKVYASHDGKDKKAKGLTTKKLTVDDFAAWYSGRPPTMRQIQRQNFVAVMAGADMFVEREKVGQRL